MSKRMSKMCPLQKPTPGVRAFVLSIQNKRRNLCAKLFIEPLCIKGHANPQKTGHWSYVNSQCMQEYLPNDHKKVSLWYIAKSKHRTYFFEINLTKVLNQEYLQITLILDLTQIFPIFKYPIISMEELDFNRPAYFSAIVDLF